MQATPGWLDCVHGPGAPRPFVLSVDSLQLFGTLTMTSSSTCVTSGVTYFFRTAFLSFVCFNVTASRASTIYVMLQTTGPVAGREPPNAQCPQCPSRVATPPPGPITGRGRDPSGRGVKASLRISPTLQR